MLLKKIIQECGALSDPFIRGLFRAQVGDCVGDEVRSYVATMDECATDCEAEASCGAFVYTKVVAKTCWLLKGCHSVIYRSGLLTFFKL